MLKVLENIDPNKFIAIVSDAEAAMQSAKRKVIEKYPHIMAIRCIAHHINLVTKDIISIEWAKKHLKSVNRLFYFFMVLIELELHYVMKLKNSLLEQT